MIIDLSYLREMSGGNKDLILEMITIFKNQTLEFGSEMDQLLQSKQYELLGKLAHKAKSSVSIMGMEKLASQLKELELAAKDGIKTESYGAIVDDFKRDTATAVKELDLVVENLDIYF